MHDSTFEYLKPTEEQIETMATVRAATKTFYTVLEDNLPLGPDRTYTLRTLRTVVMWANVSITRTEDGTPRK